MNVNFLRDTIWQFIFGLLGVGIAVLIYFLQRHRKSLSYQIVSEVPLLSVREDLGGNIKILFGEKAVPNVQLVVLRILNDGNTPVLANDFQNNLRFSFGQKTSVLSAEVIETVPRTFRPVVAIESNCVVFQPALWNSGDVATIRLLLGGHDNLVECDSRIVGVRDVKKVKEGFNLSGMYTSMGIVLLFTGIVLFSILFYGWSHLSIGFAFRQWIFLLQFAFSTILVIAGMVFVVLGLPIRIKDTTRYQSMK
jgi:hypothetical protein